MRRATVADQAALTALQQAAYAANRAALGVEPLPLQADYGAILRSMEVWLLQGEGGLHGALILEPGDNHLLIWSIAAAPGTQGRGLGRRMLLAAEERARALGLGRLKLYTGEKLGDRVAWYGRHGYAVERVEALSDRRIVHMVKEL